MAINFQKIYEQIQEIGAGRGDVFTPGSSLFIINRDPFRSIRRGRQLFQRKFTKEQGQGPGVGDGVGNISANNAIGAGLSDSCAGCHARPRGSAGFGGGDSCDNHTTTPHKAKGANNKNLFCATIL